MHERMPALVLNLADALDAIWAAYVLFPRPDRKEVGLGLSQHVHLFRPVALPLRLRKHSSEREAISCRQAASRFGAPHVHPAPHRHSPVGIKWQMVNPFRTGSVTTGGTLFWGRVGCTGVTEVPLLIKPVKWPAQIL